MMAAGVKKWWLTGLLGLLLWPVDVPAQEGLWKARMEKAVSAHRQGDTVEAERQLALALEAAESFEEVDHRLAETLMGLASIRFDQQDYEAAGPFLVRAVEVYEQVLEPDDTRLASGLNALALVYTREGRYEQAEPHFRRALEILESTLGPEHHSTGDVLNNLAGLLLAWGRFEDAAPVYEEVLAARERSLGSSHTRVAETLESYAMVLRMIGREAEADRHQARAKKIFDEDANAQPSN